ncbi:hypothetical protein JZ751_019270 [Albula glossodonta]|uniref:Uncharacterized protein n=1 Tax=Albula glossodonta TaxID=121402 RepID=A0A8T2NQJ5_9TELE|nr:hypothetical protein JZ751_019270 [Albula glossodonta]
MAFVTGALAFWTPVFLSRAQVTQGLRPPCSEEPCDTSDSFIFGAITVVTGILGVVIGTSIAKRLRDRVPNADPLICAVGMLTSAPCFFLAIVLAYNSIPATYVSDALSKYNPDTFSWKFRSLEYSVLLCPFVGVLGGLFFLMTALYITEDRKAAQLLTAGNNGAPSTGTDAMNPPTPLPTPISSPLQFAFFPQAYSEWLLHSPSPLLCQPDLR